MGKRESENEPPPSPTNTRKKQRVESLTQENEKEKEAENALTLPEPGFNTPFTTQTSTSSVLAHNCHGNVNLQVGLVPPSPETKHTTTDSQQEQPSNKTSFQSPEDSCPLRTSSMSRDFSQTPVAQTANEVCNNERNLLPSTSPPPLSLSHTPPPLPPPLYLPSSSLQTEHLQRPSGTTVLSHSCPTMAPSLHTTSPQQSHTPPILSSSPTSTRSPSPHTPPTPVLEPVQQYFEMRDLECPLCQSLFYNPVTTSCGHTFCRDCLIKAIDHNNKCPICRVVVWISNQHPVNYMVLKTILKYFPGEYKKRRKEVVWEEEDLPLSAPSPSLRGGSEAIDDKGASEQAKAVLSPTSLMGSDKSQCHPNHPNNPNNPNRSTSHQTPGSHPDMYNRAQFLSNFHSSSSSSSSSSVNHSRSTILPSRENISLPEHSHSFPLLPSLIHKSPSPGTSPLLSSSPLSSLQPPPINTLHSTTITSTTTVEPSTTPFANSISRASKANKRQNESGSDSSGSDYRRGEKSGRSSSSGSSSSSSVSSDSNGSSSDGTGNGSPSSQSDGSGSPKEGRDHHDSPGYGIPGEGEKQKPLPLATRPTATPAAMKFPSNRPIFTLSLFILDDVLFPGMQMPLHIFDPRYKQMISQLDGKKFGVLSLVDGKLSSIGTTAIIENHIRLNDGRSLLFTRGGKKFHIISTQEGEGGYKIGKVVFLVDDTDDEEELGLMEEEEDLEEKFMKMRGQVRGSVLNKKEEEKFADQLHQQQNRNNNNFKQQEKSTEQTGEKGSKKEKGGRVFDGAIRDKSLLRKMERQRRREKRKNQIMQRDQKYHEVVKELTRQVGSSGLQVVQYKHGEMPLDNAESFSFWLACLLKLPVSDKLLLLETSSTTKRLDSLLSYLTGVNSSQLLADLTTK
eukprot:TRINITY_DN5688_c0_g1_i1.p1 TRINITY_DN5688_c0_g1~~TRINITY_DN5688_c0_g1_i1.p1  ORF type:complete len:926 (+),score=251.98 TRINITY_DN5688_c0_g1_i1:77-2779(+)